MVIITYQGEEETKLEEKFRNSKLYDIVKKEMPDCEQDVTEYVLRLSKKMKKCMDIIFDGSESFEPYSFVVKEAFLNNAVRIAEFYEEKRKKKGIKEEIRVKVMK